MRNTRTDLNNHLFEQLERLNDKKLEGDALKSEIERSKAVTQIANSIIDNANLSLRVAMFKDNALGAYSPSQRTLGSGK